MLLRFLGYRLVQLIPVWLGLSVLIFLLARVIPGDPVRLALGPEATPEQVETLRQELGLDRPLWEQYLRYMAGLFRGDWGMSLRTYRNVWEDLRLALPATVELVTAAMLLAVFLGVPLGVMAALRQHRGVDQVTRVVALLGVAMPRFWLGILLQLLFALVWRVLPAVGRGEPAPPVLTGFRLVDSLLAGDGAAWVASLEALILPALTLSLGALAQIMRLTRAAMIQEGWRDYILAARAFGLPERLVAYKYMLKNALGTTLTVVGLTYGFLLGNAFLVEYVFAWPGMAYYGVEAVIYKDFNGIIGVTLVVGAFFALINTVVDALYAWLDPRVRYG